MPARVNLTSTSGTRPVVQLINAGQTTLRLLGAVGPDGPTGSGGATDAAELAVDSATGLAGPSAQRAMEDLFDRIQAVADDRASLTFN